MSQNEFKLFQFYLTIAIQTHCSWLFMTVLILFLKTSFMKLYLSINHTRIFSIFYIIYFLNIFIYYNFVFT